MYARLMNIMMAILVVMALAELIYAVVRKKPTHSFKDTLSSLALGIGQQAINVYLSGGFLVLFTWIHEHLAIVRADPGVWWHWLLFTFACDLSYYTAHRTSHNVNLWVSGHVVHHQALDYNHLSAMRQGWTAWLLNCVFFLPLALFVPLEIFVFGQLCIMFMQFLSHNGLFRWSLGPLDKLLVTPANHRVHHGVNQPYLGANCGGMYVIWDRLFGTYVEEDPDIPIVMGSGLPTNFYDPFQANLDYYRRILFVARHRPTFSGKVAIWFQSPRVLLDELRRHGFDEAADEALNQAPASARGKALALTSLFASIGLLFFHRLTFEAHGLAVQLATGAAVMLALWALGRLLTLPAPQPSLGRSQVKAR